MLAMTLKTNGGNLDFATVESFGSEWAKFDQSALSHAELLHLFDCYFSIFPWHLLSPDAEGFDMGCGSGRWAKLVAPRVGRLNCVDPSGEALAVARSMLAQSGNVEFYQASVDGISLAPASQDFGYSLGVLHHTPDPEAALRSCVSLLKPGAPFLLYLYYRFDNRPLWFRLVWHAANAFRTLTSRLPTRAKFVVTDAIASAVYWPLARGAWVWEKLGNNPRTLPLSFYRNASFYTMRTDSRDRFGTPLEHRFTRVEIKTIMERAGLVDVHFSECEPYWCATGCKGLNGSDQDR
jgi:SAM-dependent methyltransferase